MATAKSKSRIKKVWYISRFRERYELPEDIRFDRKSPLQYTKDFCGSGVNDESCGYFRQLMALRSKPNWLELRGAFSELKSMAGNMSRSYRGYLLDGALKQATIEEIGRWLGVDEKRAEDILSDLADVGLLELVNMPTIKADDKEPKSKKKSHTKKKKTKKKTATKKVSSTPKKPCTNNSVRTRARKCAHVKAREPLKRNIKTNVKIKSNDKTKANVTIGNDKTSKENNNGNKKRTDNFNALEGENKSRQETESSSAKCRQAALAPTTTPSLVPKVSDERGSDVIKFPNHSTPSRSVKYTRTDPHRLGDIIQGMKHRYDQDSKQFALEIYQALKLPCDPTSPEGRRELGSFASVWTKAKASGLPPPVLDKLWSGAVEKARRIAPRRSKGDNVAAIWCKVFNDSLAKRCKSIAM